MLFFLASSKEICFVVLSLKVKVTIFFLWFVDVLITAFSCKYPRTFGGIGFSSWLKSFSYFLCLDAKKVAKKNQGKPDPCLPARQGSARFAHVNNYFFWCSRMLCICLASLTHFVRNENPRWKKIYFWFWKVEHLNCVKQRWGEASRLNDDWSQ